MKKLIIVILFISNFAPSQTSNSNDLDSLLLNGEAISNSFGTSVSNAGDVNGDGFSDIIIGATGYRSETDTGRVYIFYGGTNMNNVPDIILTGEGTLNVFGLSVSGAGDVNGDGYADVIGARGFSNYPGKAYIYFGGSSMNDSVDVILTGEVPGSEFGNSVSDAGDVNGDGYDDVVVGTYEYW